MKGKEKDMLGVGMVVDERMARRMAREERKKQMEEAKERGEKHKTLQGVMKQKRSVTF